MFIYQHFLNTSIVFSRKLQVRAGDGPYAYPNSAAIAGVHTLCPVCHLQVNTPKRLPSAWSRYCTSYTFDPTRLIGDNQMSTPDQLLGDRSLCSSRAEHREHQPSPSFDSGKMTNEFSSHTSLDDSERRITLSTDNDPSGDSLSAENLNPRILSSVNTKPSPLSRDRGVICLSDKHHHRPSPSFDKGKMNKFSPLSPLATSEKSVSLSTDNYSTGTSSSTDKLQPRTLSSISNQPSSLSLPATIFYSKKSQQNGPPMILFDKQGVMYTNYYPRTGRRS